MKATKPPVPSPAIPDMQSLLPELRKTISLMQHLNENIDTAENQNLLTPQQVSYFKEIHSEYSDTYSRMLAHVDHLKAYYRSI